MQASPSSNERKLESSPATVKPCVKCGSTERHKPRPGRKIGNCKACSAASVKAYRAANHEACLAAHRAWSKANAKKIIRKNQRYGKTNPEKRAARKAISMAIRRGDLPRVSTCDCVDCGIQAAEYHHEDYSKPLEVEPLCKKCHVKRHKPDN